MTACRFNADLGYRVLARGDHDEPCPERHCCVCSRGHCDDTTPQTCSPCVGDTRDNLSVIVELTERLEDEATHSHADGRLNTGPLGGDAMVMLSPGSDGRARAWARERGDRREATGYSRGSDGDVSHQADEVWTDPVPPLLLLGTWEDDWRETLGHPVGPQATVWRCVDYLSQHLTMMAQRHLAFDDFAADMARVRGRLEAVLHDGDQPETAEAVCLKCGGRLIRPVTERGLDDDWRCTGRCRRRLSPDDYHLALRQFTEAHLATAPALAVRFGVEAATIRQWATRGHIKRWGVDVEGRTLYRIGEVQRHAQRGEQGA